MNIKSLKIFKWILYLTWLHSFVVGIGLIFITNQLRVFLGFVPSQEQFFQTQGGVFHILMSIAYFLGGINPQKYKTLIWFSIIVKLFATIFLLTYFLVINPSILILLSGITDLIMFVLILYFYKKVFNT